MKNLILSLSVISVCSAAVCKAQTHGINGYYNYTAFQMIEDEKFQILNGDKVAEFKSYYERQGDYVRVNMGLNSTVDPSTGKPWRADWNLSKGGTLKITRAFPVVAVKMGTVRGITPASDNRNVGIGTELSCPSLDKTNLYNTLGDGYTSNSRCEYITSSWTTDVDGNSTLNHKINKRNTGTGNSYKRFGGWDVSQYDENANMVFYFNLTENLIDISQDNGGIGINGLLCYNDEGQFNPTVFNFIIADYTCPTEGRTFGVDTPHYYIKWLKSFASVEDLEKYMEMYPDGDGDYPFEKENTAEVIFLGNRSDKEIDSLITKETTSIDISHLDRDNPEELRDLFSICDRLQWIKAGKNITDFNLQNPNTLIYTSENNTIPTDRIIITDNNAGEIVLTDKKPFNAMHDFDAKKVTYVRNFNGKTSGISKPEGWESIVLPFTPEYISAVAMDGNKYELVPFSHLENVEDWGNKRPFWIKKLNDNGLYDDVDTIKPNTPYIISIPNNEQYYLDCRFDGDIIFSAENCKVSRTTESSPVGLMSDNTHEYNSWFSLSGMSADDKIYVLDRTSGSKYIQTTYYNTEVNPFECYLVAKDIPDVQTSALPRSFVLSFRPGVSTYIEKRMLNSKDKATEKIYVSDGAIIIESSKEKEITIYTATGCSAKIINVTEGINTVTDLPKGIYIINDKKIIL